MDENCLYYGKKEYYELVRNLGGEWGDTKERPIVCLIKSSENEHLYWAIPLGNWNHRDEKAQKRILEHIQLPTNDIRSCYYHIGRTTTKSVFFISDVIPITDKYIERGYLGYNNNNIHRIKNVNLLNALDKKMRRILTYENNKNNKFRQHITTIKNFLLKELESKNK